MADYEEDILRALAPGGVYSRSGDYSEQIAALLASGKNNLPGFLASFDTAASARGVTVSSRIANTDERARRVATRSIILANSNLTPGAAGGWRVNDVTGGVLSVDSTMRRRPGIDVTKVDATGTSGAVSKAIRIKTEALTTHNGVIGIWIWVPVLSAGSFSATLRWSSDDPAADPPNVTPTNYYQLDFNNEGQQRGKWMFLSVSGSAGKIFGASNPNGITPTTVGVPTAGQVRQFEIVEGWGSTTPVNERIFYIDNVEANGKARPMVCWGFDGFGDGAVSVANKLAMFDKYGVAGYVAGDYDSAGAGLQQFYDRGWDIVPDGGPGHNDYAANPGLLAAAIDNSRAVLTQLGFTRSLDLFAYPFNSRSLATDAILAAKGIRLARTTLGNSRIVTNITGTTDLLAVASFNTDNRTAAQVQAVVDEAVASGSHLLLYGHSVTASAGSTTNQNLTEFNTSFNYCGGLYRAGTIDMPNLTVLADRLSVFA